MLRASISELTISQDKYITTNSVRKSKLEQAIRFIHAIDSDNILFAGVSGSVSYTPEPEDDIDIFLIVKENKLWTELFKSFIIRRIQKNQDICLSLNFDHKFAEKYYREIVSGLPIRDSVNAVVVTGGSYYERLLLSSPMIVSAYPNLRRNYVEEPSKKQKTRRGLIEFFLFVLLASWLQLKCLLLNKIFMNRGEYKSRFKAITGLHTFYLETEKYRELNRAFMEE